MSHFRLLKDPDSYVAHDLDLLGDDQARPYWLDLFARHFEVTLEHAAERYGPKAQKGIDGARRDFAAHMETLRNDPAALGDGTLNVIQLCRLREQVLRAHRLDDPFALIKRRENDSAMNLYMDVVRKLHAMEAEPKWLHLIECVFAGNLFDLGATPTLELARKPMDFLQTVENTKPRPWLVDDYDTLGPLLHAAPPTPWAKAVVFVDNAGADFILGVMPLVREMALGGTQIILAANERPTLNDITADETVDVVERLAEMDQHLAALIQAKMFEVVSTGNDIPLIDLREVSDELNAAAEGADLVLLEGMGRAVESNYHAQFTTDALLLALLKDTAVAAGLHGDVYDCVCKFTPVESAEGDG